ncbi:MAG TPA: GNAT family N-acetyltransferase [Caulobacteraceae bacterium]
MDIQVLRPSRLPAAMIERWRDLQDRDARLASPFLSPDWTLAVERAHGECGDQLKVAVLIDRDWPTGFLGARLCASTAIAIGAPMCDYQGVVGEPGQRLDARRVVRALGVGRLDFSHMLEDQAAFAPYAHGRSHSWIVDLAGGYDAYAKGRSAAGASLFKDLEKKKRKATRLCGPVRFTPASSDAGDLEQLFQWKRAQLRSTGQVDIFAASWPMPLMRDLFTRSDPAFRGMLLTLHMGDKLAAAHFHLLGRHTIHAWIISHDTAFERFSPGLMLFQETLRWMADEGFSRLDLGAGDYRFKRQLANATQSLMHGYVGVPSSAALVRGAAYGLRKAAETLPLGVISALPGKAMRRLDVLRALR